MARLPLRHPAIRIAARDLRGSLARSGLITVAMAIAVACIVGVRSAADAARDALENDSRAWLAGDIGVDAFEPLSEHQTAELDRSGFEWTLVTLASTMAASEQSPDPGFVSVKAVDPAVYPFYGKLRLDPPRSLRETLTRDTAAVSEEVLERLEIHTRDSISIAGRPFRIAAVIESDPTRFSNDLGIGMRCILSREAFARLDLERSGNSVRNRILLRTGDIARGRRLLEGLFPGGALREYRTGYRQQTATAITFLSLTAFVCLTLGALAVAIALREHAEHGLPTLSVMKILGARTPQIAAVLFSQIGVMMFAACALGIPVGMLLRDSVLRVTGKYFIASGGRSGEWRVLLEAAGAVLLAMTPVLIEPLVLIRRARPALVFRRDVEREALEPRFGWPIPAASLVLFVALAYSILRSWRSAFILIAMLAAGLGLAWLCAMGTFAWLGRRRFANSCLRYAMAALARPGNRSRILVVAISTSLALMIATLVASHAVIQAIFDVLPYDTNSLYIARFDDSRIQALRAFLGRQPGVEKIGMITEAQITVRRIDDAPFYMPLAVVCDPRAAPGTMTIGDDMVEKFRAHPGSRIEFDTRDEALVGRVAEIRRMTPQERLWSNMWIDCGGLDRRTLFHQAVVEIAPDRIAAVRRAVETQYPSLAVITAADVSKAIEDVSGDAMSLTRIIAWYTIGAGFAVLTAAIAASRRARRREIGILAALGATRATIRQMYTLEFGAVGALSAAISGVLTCGFTTVILSLLFHRLEIAIEWRTIGAVGAVAVLAAIFGGWLPAVGLLSHRPMEIMRRE